MTIADSNKTEISLILLDEDPIFTLGLKEFCSSEEFADLNIIATGKIKDIYSFIKEYQVDLWVVALDFDRFSKPAQEFVNGLPQLTKNYPELNIVIIVNPQNLVADFAQFSTIKGCCYKFTNIQELVNTFRRAAQGEIYFSSKDISPSQSKRINTWFYNQCKVGLKEINQQINQLNNYTQNKQLSVIDLIYWQGRKRELKVTKWLIKKALPKNRLILPNNSSISSISLQKVSELEDYLGDDRQKGEIILSTLSSSTYDLTLAKINSSLINFTGRLQETDILRKQKKQELFTIVLEKWYQLIEGLKEAKFIESELKEKINNASFIQIFFQDLLTNFLGDLVEEKAINKYESIDSYSRSLDLNLYQLDKIYFWQDLILHQVLKKDLLIDNQYYRYGTDTAQEIETILLDNLLISLANYLMQYILNNFYDNLKIKDKLFEPELKSSRKVAMFRNNLVWQYRQEKYWRNPTNIFEDKYEMLKFTYRGIETIKVTHSRHLELNQIQGIPWLVTILIELRDSLSRGVKALGDTLGQVIVYLLTEVIGKGIGLIGKGILQGIGSRIKN